MTLPSSPVARMMFAKLLRLGEPAERAHRVLKILALRHRRLADLAGGHLHVLLAQHVDHVARRKISRRQLVRVEPHAHAVVLPAEREYVAHALQTCELIEELDRGVVAHVERS